MFALARETIFIELFQGVPGHPVQDKQRDIIFIISVGHLYPLSFVLLTFHFSFSICFADFDNITLTNSIP